MKNERYLQFYFKDSFKEIKGFCDCNPNDKWSYWRNPDKPDFLSYCFFEKQVLDKYHREWSNVPISYDNWNEDYVMVYLWDLWYLSLKDQHYWKSYNITDNIEQYNISKPKVMADYYSILWSPSTHIQILKSKYECTNNKRQEKFWWFLWTIPNLEDKDKYDQLDVPMYNTLNVFDEQCARLGFVLVDLLNSNELKSYILAQGIAYDKGTQGISHLWLILNHLKYKDSEFIKLLRSIWDLRHCVHQKWDNYKRWLAYFNSSSWEDIEFPDWKYIDWFKTILFTLSQKLEELEVWLCTLQS